MFVCFSLKVGNSLATFKMDAKDKFWLKIEKSLNNKTAGSGWGECKLSSECVEWLGCKDKCGYGVKRVRWPDGSVFLERVHRVAYMCDRRLLHHQVPQLNGDGLQLDVSHLCHNTVCINPAHLVLETHSVNMSRRYCRDSRRCLGGHDPACLFCFTS